MRPWLVHQCVHQRFGPDHSGVERGSVHAAGVVHHDDDINFAHVTFQQHRLRAITRRIFRHHGKEARTGEVRNRERRVCQRGRRARSRWKAANNRRCPAAALAAVRSVHRMPRCPQRIGGVEGDGVKAALRLPRIDRDRAPDLIEPRAADRRAFVDVAV